MFETVTEAPLHHGRRLAPGLFQLTGLHLQTGQLVHERPEFPDPSPPFVTADGAVEIYGSALYYIRYGSWKDFTDAGPYEVIPLDVRYPNGAPMSKVYGHPWDLLKFTAKTNDGEKECLLGGCMSPTEGRHAGVWPDDNINRRLFLFHKQADAWVRAPNPIFGQVDSGWIEHCYGGNLFQEDRFSGPYDFTGNRPVYLFYERVSEAHDAHGPLKTEIFARKFQTLNQADSEEVKILALSNPPWPASQRTIGGSLIEGPRPAQVMVDGEKFYIIGFSSGDFPSDHYSLNYAWSRDLIGPYDVMMDHDSDLLDLGREIKKEFHLSWMGRPAFYQAPDGTWEMLFHGVCKSVLPDNDYSKWPTQFKLWEFFRCLFKAKLKVVLEKGAPRLSLDVG